MFKIFTVFSVLVSSCIICEGCACYNPLAGTAQEPLGETDYSCEFNKWCFVPCDGTCLDKKTLSGFFRGKCKSASACDIDNTPISTEAPVTPPSVGKSTAVCECLDPNGSQCSFHEKCFVLCNTCPDQTTNKRGRCVSEKACK